VTDLAKLVVRLEAETAKYQQELEKTKRHLRGVESDINKSVKRIAAVTGAAVGAAAIGFAALVRQQVNAADQFAKLARSTGLSTEALSELQYVAELSGVENLAGALNKLNKSIGDAAVGNKAQADAFKALGVSIRDANGNIRATEDILNDVADGFARYEDGAAKSKVAQDLLGESGAKLITFLNGGSEALRAGREEAAKYGLTISQDVAEASERFNDNLARTQKLTQGVATQVAGGLSKTIADLTDQYVAWASQSENIEATTQAVEFLVKGLIVSVLGLKAVISTTVGGIKALAAARKEMFDGVEMTDMYLPPVALYKFARNLGDAADAMKAPIADARATLTNDIEAIMRVIEAGRGELEKMTREQGADSGRESLNLPNAAEMQEALRELDEHARLLIAAEEALRREHQMLAAEGDRLAQSLRTPTEIWEDQVALIDKLYNGGFITAETRTRALADANETLYASLDRLEPEFEQTAQAMSVFADQAARNMQDAFADFLFDPFEDGLRGMARSFAQTLQRMAADALAAQIFSALGGALGASGNPFLAAAGAFLQGGARANGGPVEAGKAYTVGETGRELFIPDVAGMIVPNDELGGLGGGPNIRIINTPDPALMGDYLGSAAGEVQIMNVIRRNPGIVRQIASGQLV
jgi:hypothetical protein